MLEPVSFSDLTGWSTDDHLRAFTAFCISARRMVDKPYKTRKLNIDASLLAAVAKKALAAQITTSSEARDFFETCFTVYKLSAFDESDDEPGGASGFLTGYFEPEVKASRQQSDAYPIPLYRQPPELVEIDEITRPASMDRDIRFARKTDQGFEVYFDRGEIQSGALKERGLELVWLQNKVDAFFIHVQGSARLLLDDGDLMRVTYAAKSGHVYSSLGKILCERLDVLPAEMTADKLRDWMTSHPDQQDELLANNRSYIFFEEVVGLDPKAGPIAAAKVPLINMRSLAVDRTLHTFGSPVWIDTLEPLPGETRSARRLMIAHDTGSAIIGAARGDIFVGTGDRAGMIAGKIRHKAELYVFAAKPQSGSDK